MTGAPRVLFVTHNVPRHAGDAAGSFVLRLASALQAAGATVDILAPGAPGLPAEDRIDGVRITRVRYASDARMTLAYEGTMVETVRASWSGRLALLQLLWHLRRGTRQALDLARRDGRPYDIVHAHWWFPAGLALWRLRRSADPPLVITMHGSDVRLAVAMRAAHPVMRRVLSGARGVTTVSSWLASLVERIAPDIRVGVEPMPIEIEPARVDNAKAMTDTTDDGREGILFVGRLNAQKGVQDLLEAMARPELGRAILTVIGDGPDRVALEQRAAAVGIADRIRWIGRVPHEALHAWYGAARVVAVPSRGEGLGLVAVEAQCAGTPVVGYADAGLLDVVDPALGNRLVAPGDTQALASALADRLAAPKDAVARDMARAGEALRMRFAPAAVADRYVAVYRSASATWPREAGGGE